MGAVCWVASSPVPLSSRAGRRAARFALGKKEGPGIQRSRMRQFLPKLKILVIRILIRILLYTVGVKRHNKEWLTALSWLGACCLLARSHS